MKLVKLFGVVIFALVVTGAPVCAQPKAIEAPPAPVPVVGQNLTSVWFSGSGLGAGLGMALTVIGAGYGMGRIGQAALESMARQPEVAPRVQTAMIIIAAMLEGATLASVIFCFIVGVAKSTF